TLLARRPEDGLAQDPGVADPGDPALRDAAVEVPGEVARMHAAVNTVRVERTGERLDHQLAVEAVREFGVARSRRSERAFQAAEGAQRRALRLHAPARVASLQAQRTLY